MSTPDRAEWVAALRTVIAIVEEHPEIQLPAVSTGIGGHTISWWLWGDTAPAHMAALEAALPCELTESVETGGEHPGRPDRYRLTGALGGFKVEISATAEHVASVTVTSEVVQKREWARKPVEPVEPETAEGEEQS